MRTAVLLAIALACFAAEAKVSLRGRLVQESGNPPAIVKDGKRISLESDEPSMKVLNDERLNNSDFEVAGHFVSPDRFAVNHIHTSSLFVHRGGKRLVVSYWCDVCYIRTSSPGICWCCQKNTDLDPIEPER